MATEEGTPMETDTGPAEPTEPAEPAEPADPTQPTEPAEPATPKPKPRKKKTTIRDPAQQEPPTRAKRQNQRVITPPSLVVEQTFWTGLLATQKARKREARQQTLSNFRIFG